MAPTSLLVCADAEAVQILSRIFQDLGIEVEICGDPRAARPRTDEKHFEALLVDCQDEAAAIALIEHIRGTTLNHPTVVIAMVNTWNSVREIFDKGANFVFYKPISRERATHSIRAAQSLMRSERRIAPRIALHTGAAMAYAGKENVPATLIDLNESGLAMQAGDMLPLSCKVYFQFALPENQSLVRLAGEVMWQDVAGRVGIRFVQVPQASRRVLQSWVQANLPGEAESAEPAAGSAQKDDSLTRLSAGLGLISTSSGDRRQRLRQACNLGAEVYRAASGVPTRCNLSDISPGGCFVETTESLPKGTPVEIVVRTAEQKLCIAGRVTSTNPGFGMGVQFSLRNDEQKKQVQYLIASGKMEPKLT